MHLPNETSVTTLNAVTVNVWLWLEIILNKPRRLVFSAYAVDTFAFESQRYIETAQYRQYVVIMADKFDYSL